MLQALGLIACLATAAQGGAVAPSTSPSTSAKDPLTFTHQAGNTMPGTTASLSAAMRRTAGLTLDVPEKGLNCAVIDTAHGFAYFGTWTTPGKVLKVRLSDFKRVGALTLNRGENYVGCAVIASAGDYAWFAVQNQNDTRVIKVRLSDMVRVGALDLNVGENQCQSAVIAPAGDYAWFGIGSSPGMVVQVRLADMTRVGTLTFNAGENGVPSAAIEPSGKYACFGTFGRNVIKVRLADLTRVGTLTLREDEGNPSSALVDASGRYAYFLALNQWTCKMIKVRLSDFTRVGALSLYSGGDCSQAVIDPSGSYAWFAMDAPGEVVKVRLADMTITQSLPLDNGYNFLRSAVIDPAGGYVYFGTIHRDGSVPGQVLKLRLSDLKHVGTLVMNSGENYVSCALIDSSGEYAYLGLGGTTNQYNPPLAGKILKIRLADCKRVGTLTLKTEETKPYSGVIDPTHGYAYFGTTHLQVGNQTVLESGAVVKVRLADFTRVGALTLNTGESYPQYALIDHKGGYAYFSTHCLSSRQATVIKIRLSDFTRVGALTFNPGEQYLTCAQITPDGAFAYFVVDKSMMYPFTPKQVMVKVRLADMKRIGAQNLNSDEDNVSCVVIDSQGDFAYFGLCTAPGIIVKVRLSDYSITGRLRLNLGEDYLDDAVLAPTGDYAWFGTNTGQVVKIRLSDLTPMGSLTLNPWERALSCAAITPDGESALFGTWTEPGNLVKVALSTKNAIHASRLTMSEQGPLTALHFYSHEATGHVRLALYDGATPKRLLWQSGSVANTVAGDWLPVPIASGQPSALNLAPGTYWLAWQCDTNAAVPSALSSAAGEGFEMEQPYGPFPAKLGEDQIQSSGNRWSEFVSYTVLNGVASWWRGLE